MQKVVAGIDYSLSCPCLCIYTGDTFSFDNCKFYYVLSSKKLVGTFGKNIFGSLTKEHTLEPQRYENLANHFIDIIEQNGVQYVGVEGYAMGGSGRVFSIGENTGLLKYKIYKMSVPFIIPPPTVIKKFATGKGNANKEIMYEHFFKQTGVDIKALYGYTKTTIGSPISDIVDSYFIAKYTFTNF